MIFLKGVSIKEYSSVVGGKGSRFPELWCPLLGCGERLAGHGGYKRYVGGQLSWIRRGICARCQVSHAIVAEDLVAYRDLTLGELETLWEASGAAAAARALGQSGEAALRRVRCVYRRMGERVLGQIQALLPVLGEQDLILAPAPGILVWLRVRLWSALKLFFSGLTGLWRHGRPPHLGRGAPHKPW